MHGRMWSNAACHAVLLRDQRIPSPRERAVYRDPRGFSRLGRCDSDKPVRTAVGYGGEQLASLIRQEAMRPRTYAWYMLTPRTTPPARR
ncbi:hypothetical protein XFF6990_90147 [Xanthomonas citri pv. fuscans]|nr:hypothetical protein XFF6990_90147 [Xanthomonas citri pv. fuscans]